MVGYQPELGLLTFKVISSGKLSRAESREYLATEDSKAKNVHAERVEFTLRSLVASTLSFDGGQQQSTGGSCAVAAAFKFMDKNSAALLSSGKMETQLLDRLKTRYAEHGLDY
jgi:putative heme iron utilization protein